MASVNGTNYALMATPRIGTWPNAAQSRSARVYCMSDECYSTDTAESGSHFYCGKLPAGVVPLISVVWPIDTDTFGEGDPTAAGATGQLGILATITDKGDTIAADIDLFGDIAALTTGTPQVIEPCPDATIYTTTLDFALRQETIPVMTSGTADIVSTEGIALKILYTHGGRTY